MRKIERIYKTIPAIEGAGVHLRRGFSNREVDAFDPFLLFDDFSNTERAMYEAGFPTHPHRGIETVTYILRGEVHHKDSIGNEGSIKDGEVQWMSAGSGILHSEMPVVHEGGISGFQLWVNIPQAHKMDKPRYQDIKAEQIPVVKEDGTEVKVITGNYKDATGPAEDITIAPTYLDVTLNPRVVFSYRTDREDTFFVYVIKGRLAIRDDRSESWIGEGEIGLLTKDSEFRASAGGEGAHFLVIGGKPLNEPVAWWGPIVMNTDAEIQTAIQELRDGTFIK